jgi:hypothetical protein
MGNDGDIEVVTREWRGGWLGAAGCRFASILSRDLFGESLGVRGRAWPADDAGSPGARWLAFSEAAALLPAGTQWAVVHAPATASFTGVLALAHDPRRDEAASRARDGMDALRALLVANCDHLEVEPNVTAESLTELVSRLVDQPALEIVRAVKPVVFAVVPATGAIGYGRDAAVRGRAGYAALDVTARWESARDDWGGLLQALASEPAGTALVVRGASLSAHGVAGGTDVARDLEGIERALLNESGNGSVVPLRLDGPLQQLRDGLADRGREARQPALGVRVFLSSRLAPSAATLATVQASVARQPISERAARSAMLGGTCVREVPLGTVVEPLHGTSEELASPAEAVAVIRTADPPLVDLPGLPVARTRTAELRGRSGGDAVLGINSHRGVRRRVQMDAEARFRHAYLVGQTGTGKSTLLLRMARHDIRAGRGVAVLDPHGPLVESLLRSIPEERIDDVVLLDVTDLERPVPFNLLRIYDESRLGYRVARDLLIDDLYHYFRRSYHSETMGPIFETHMRGMLALLLGNKPAQPPRVPNLMHLSLLYSDESARRRLALEARGADPVTDHFIEMTNKSTSDYSYAGTATYVTSKFNRFIADATLRNITCQNDVIDFDAIVRDRRILLCYLGKGRFGDMAAGLLASQIMSRLRSAVMRRGIGCESPPFYVFADEFQLFADDRVGELLAEARKFGLSLTLAHQYLSQLPQTVLDAVLGNVGTTVAFRVGGADAERLALAFAPTFRASELVSLPNHRAVVRSFGGLGDAAFSLATELCDDEGSSERADRVRSRSRERYGRDIDMVEREVREALDAFTKSR